MLQELNFEEAMSRLQEIAIVLESGEESLENSMSLFEESIKLAALCNKKLENAKQKITEISINSEKLGNEDTDDK